MGELSISIIVGKQLHRLVRTRGKKSDPLKGLPVIRQTIISVVVCCAALRYQYSSERGKPLLIFISPDRVSTKSKVIAVGRTIRWTFAVIQRNRNDQKLRDELFFLVTAYMNKIDKIKRVKKTMAFLLICYRNIIKKLTFSVFTLLFLFFHEKFIG